MNGQAYVGWRELEIWETSRREKWFWDFFVKEGTKTKLMR